MSTDASPPLLREPALQVSPRAPLVWAVEAAGSALVLTALLVAATLWWDLVDVPTWAWVPYAVVALGYVIGMPAYRYRVHRWETTETAVYTQRGWLTRERRIAPMSRVQTVDFHQGALSRLLRLADVTVTTASAAGPVRIEGLDRTVAEQLVEDLTRRTEAEPGDAT